MLSIKMSRADIWIVQKEYVNNIPTMQFFIGISRSIQLNIISYHWLSVSGNSVMMHYGVLINMPY